MSKMKECPMCGSDRAMMKSSYELDGPDTTWKYVECGDCGLRTRGKWFSGNNDCPIFYEEVRGQWNQRIERFNGI